MKITTQAGRLVMIVSCISFINNTLSLVQHNSFERISKMSLLERWISHSTTDFHAIENPDEIRAALLRWYDKERRMLPWRGDPPPWNGSTAKDKNTQTMKHEGQEAFPVTPYGVWVCEIMCQQTRVEAVIPYWLRWMENFPTVLDLAQASEEQVNALWAGLGFYRRARLLHSAAKYIANDLNGEMPKTVEGLMQLSGVGRYTAGAIASIAYNIAVPAVDGNVCRVMSRLCIIAQHIKAKELKDEWAWHLAKQIVEAGDSSRPGCVNSALMELGATYCSPKATGLDERDPLKEFYLSTKLGRELHDSMEGGRYEEYKTLAVTRIDHKKKCDVCSNDGIFDILENFENLLNESLQSSSTPESHSVTASQCGHAVFPLSPPKMHKREEVYAVGVFSSRCTGGDYMWLLVRRPKEGLLANQWEFPSALIWTSEPESGGLKGNKRKDMSNDVPVIAKQTRKKALDTFVKELRSGKDKGAHSSGFHVVKRSHVSETPIVHVFSHVRHTMWIEHAHLDVKPETYDWVDVSGREVRWMRESEMSQVGVTSGVRKVLSAVQLHREKTMKDGTSTIKRQRQS